jgi:ssDNA-binding replication factor A large subunit
VVWRDGCAGTAVAVTDRPDPERVKRRAELLPEEEQAGSDDPVAQADAILEDSEERTLDRDAAPDSVVERRTSEETVDPT